MISGLHRICSLVMLLSVIGFGIVSCDLVNPDDPIPSYLYINDFQLNIEPDEGSNSSAITDAWLYVNGEFLGAYQTPAIVPVIARGNSEIILFPGIKDNGIRATPDIYPFFETATYNRELKVQVVDTLRPGTRYSDNTQFTFIENFESSNIFIDDIDGDTETAITVSDLDAKDGGFAGRIVLNTEHSVLRVATFEVYPDLPVNGAAAYVELDYRNNVEFSLGLIGHDQFNQTFTNVILTMRKRDNWNKIYINLTEALRLSQFDGYQIIIQAVHDAENVESEIFLDNIKLIHL